MAIYERPKSKFLSPYQEIVKKFMLAIWQHFIPHRKILLIDWTRVQEESK